MSGRQIDYQNDLRPTSWLTLTSGFFYSRVNAGQERPFVFASIWAAADVHERSHSRKRPGFCKPPTTIDNLIFVAGGRLDHFNQFGDVWTYRFASSYKIDKTNTTLHSSVATGFSPPSSQDKIFGNNFGLQPEKDLGWDVGVEQTALGKSSHGRRDLFSQRLVERDRVQRAFQNAQPRRRANAGIGSGIARAADRRSRFHRELHLSWTPKKLRLRDISQLQGARLPRRPRNEVYVSASYLWWKKLRTTAEAKFVNAREELNFGGPNFDIEDYQLR